MSKKNILLAITNGQWLIDQGHAESLGGYVATVLSKLSLEKKDDEEEFQDKADEKYILEEKILLVASDHSSYQSSDLKFSNAGQGSIAIITISGPMMKEDNCGDPGTKTYMRLIQNAAANPNIIAIILEMDTPGGTVAGTQSLANAVGSVEKPVVTLADDMMASAGYWVGMMGDYIMANSNTTLIGSIGTMSSFTDMTKRWEAMGVKFHEIRADESSDKNAFYTEAREGNYARYKAEILNPLNNQFLSAVRTQRGDKLKIDQENMLTGKVYVAPDAERFGLIDGIGNMNAAIDKAFELAEAGPQSKTKNQNHNMKKITLLASQIVLLALCGATVPAGSASVEVDLTDEMQAKIEDKLAAAEQAAKDLADAKTKITTLEAAANTSATRITSLEKDLTDTKAELKALQEENPGASGTQSTGAEDTGEENDDDAFMTSVDKEKAELKKKGLA